MLESIKMKPGVKEGEPMRRILYKKNTSVENRSKAISVSESSEDKECRTFVKKSFIYTVAPVSKIEAEIPSPEIFIKKVYDTETKEEKFSFRIRGMFYITRDQSFFKVNFCHSLNIHIVWKHSLLPKVSNPGLK